MLVLDGVLVLAASTLVNEAEEEDTIDNCMWEM